MATTYDPGNTLAPMPPRGWNSYNPFGGMHGLPGDANPALPGGVALEERVVLETADALVESGLRDAGYVYLNLDDRWQDPITPRDRQGVLQADRRRFPHGIAFVAERAHERGLRFGIYTVANIVACGGEEGCGPHGIPETGSLGSERIDAETFAEWGVDFLKIDWCGVDEAGNRGRAAEIFGTWNEAIAATGRPMVLSASTWGEEAEENWAPGLAHLWRTTGDLHPTWESVQSVARATAGPRWRGVAGRGRGWNDPDFLHVGHPALTLAESWTHLVIWAMLSAPLLAGNDVRRMRPEIRSMLLDPDLLAIDADESEPAEVEEIGAWQVWNRRLANGTSAVAAVNLSNLPAFVPAEVAAAEREVSAGGATGERVPPHGTRLTIGSRT